MHNTNVKNVYDDFDKKKSLMRHRQLKKRKLSIGLIVDTIDESYQSLVWPGIVDYAAENNINIIMFVSATLANPDKLDLNYDLIVNFVSKENLDGLIIMTGAMGYYYNAAEIQKFVDNFKTLPITCIAFPVPGTSTILGDNETGVVEIMRHLVETHNCKKIAFVRGPEGHPEAEERYQAYRKALVKNKLEYNERLVVPGHFSFLSGKEAVKILIDERKEKVDAIMAADDETAFGVVEALYEHDIRIPYDVAVTGFDNVDETKLSNPPLTTVGQKFYDQGRKAMEKVIAMINGEKISDEIVLSTEIVIRESCGCFSKNVMKIKPIPRTTTAKIQTPNKDRNFKQRLLSEILHEFGHCPVEKETLSKWLGELLDSLLNIRININETDVFLFIFNDILIKYARSGGDIALWHNVLSLLRNHFLEYLSNTGQIQEYEFLFQRTRVLISDMDNRNQLIKIIEQRQKNMRLGEVSKSLIITFDLNALLDLIEEALKMLDIPGCFISLYDNTIDPYQSFSWNPPEKSNLIFAYFNKQRIKLSKENSFLTKKLIPDINGISYFPGASIFMPLHFKDEHLGFIIFEYCNIEKSIYETLRSHISTAIKGSLLFYKQKQTHNDLVNALEELDFLNKKLKDLSLKDELTSLYNRRGFFEFAQKHYSLACKFKTKFLLLYIDLDRLKLINDTFGHNEGDEAIKGAAQILMQSFREIDIIGRISGDEFVVLVNNGDFNDVKDIKQRIRANSHNYNTFSKKPYNVSMSIGAAVFEDGMNYSFDELIAMADESLYEEKQRKRANKYQDSEVI